MNATKELTFNLLNKFQDKERFGSAQRHAGISLKGFISAVTLYYFKIKIQDYISGQCRSENPSRF
ncbi:CFF_collapsed_G0035990.mRNA.1.CDS.1 [Saccharomyces cerevisiae]|nr:BPK_collapsed_G0035040.mRNA.1.CDS.1 [Saccharomyces cerevisiae]CAI7404740.1 CFF_collapsed_G0035990.mRNA.1.CDS.1 [Saccharomyces cerevisiae]CAI7421536.1 CIH_collapsed_G0035380.mRNA.1.CDS.1 [Saccharomyces cerevisiae]